MAVTQVQVSFKNQEHEQHLFLLEETRKMIGQKSYRVSDGNLGKILKVYVKEGCIFAEVDHR